MIDAEKDPWAEEAIKAWERLRTDRSDHENDWRDIDRLIRAAHVGEWSEPDAGDANRRRDKALSSAPISAQQNFSAGLYGALVNPSNKWMGIQASDPDLNAWGPMGEWRDTVTTRILNSFHPSVSTFYNSAVQLFGDVTAFGNSIQFDYERRGERRIIDNTVALSEIVYEIDADGAVIGVCRKFRLTAQQAARMFGKDQLPEKMQEKAGDVGGHRYPFYHRVRKNDEFVEGRFGPRGRRFLSIFVSEEGRKVVKKGGMYEQGFFAARWNVHTGQTYAIGQGHHALPASRVLNLMEEANLKAGQRAADPTILAPSRDWSLEGRIAPGEVLHGGMGVSGQRMIGTLDNYGGTGLSIEMSREKVAEIRDAFHYSLMSLAGRTGMTATEVMTINEERLRLMSPFMGRIQDEYLAPKIRRRFMLLWRAGQLPPLPEGAPDEIELDIQYQSAAAQAQRAGEAASTARMLADLTPLAQVKPGLLDRLSEDDIAEIMQEAHGAPARTLLTREEAAERRAAQAQAQAQAQAVQTAQAGAAALRDVAQAGAAMDSAA